MVRALFRQFVPVPASASTISYLDQPFRARMGENDPDLHRLSELGRKLKEARGNRDPVPEQQSRQSQLGIAFRLVAELVVAAVVGGAVGWALDRVFGTSPILLIVMFFAGIAAGFRNVLRAAREMNETKVRKD